MVHERLTLASSSLKILFPLVPEACCDTQSRMMSSSSLVNGLRVPFAVLWLQGEPTLVQAQCDAPLGPPAALCSPTR